MTKLDDVHLPPSKVLRGFFETESSPLSPDLLGPLPGPLAPLAEESFPPADPTCLGPPSDIRDPFPPDDRLFSRRG